MVNMLFEFIRLNRYASTVHTDPVEKEKDPISPMQHIETIHPPLDGCFGEGEQEGSTQ